MANVSRTASGAASRRCAGSSFIAPAAAAARPGRSNGKRGRKDEAEEEGFRFGDHAFKVGEYVSVREEEGELLTFRVVSVGNP